MIASLGTLVRRVAEQLATEHQVHAALDEVARAVDAAETPSEAVAAARAHLRQRSRAIKAAARKLEQLRATAAHLAEVLAFTEEGWPERKAELEASLASDVDEGLAAWLDDWFKAAVYCRTAALDRLTAVESLPPASALLVERCRTATRGLEQESWYTAHALLAAGAAGIPLGEETVPAPAVRADACLLAARLALAELDRTTDPPRRVTLDEAATSALGAAERYEPSPKTEALRARWHRLRGEVAAAATRLENVAAEAPADLDVAAELIQQARAEERWELAIDLARNAIDALPTLADYEAELMRLVDDVPELWAAVAERAVDEGELESFADAAARAESLAAWSAHALRATVAELRARVADAGGAAVPERVAAHVTAGNQRLWAGQLDAAVRHFEAALALDADSVDAALGVADGIVALAAALPAAQSRAELERAVELIGGAQARDGVHADNSWAYLAEADARERLAQLAIPEADSHRWLALLAVCRSLAYQFDAANRWVELTSAAEALQLYSLPDAAAARAVELDPENPQAVATRVQTLANRGRLQDALELMGERGEPWDQAVRAYILLRLGEPGEAVRLLRSVELSPAWSWAHQTLIAGLLLSGREEEADAAAEAHREHAEDRLQEQDGVLSAAFASLVLGRPERAESLAEPFAETVGEAAWATGYARLLLGHADRGLDALVTSIRLTRSNAELDDWKRFSEPLLACLAARRGVDLPSFERVEEAVADRRAELEAYADPVAELADAEPGGADPALVDLAKRMGAAVLHLARDEPAAALGVLEATEAADPALAALHRLAAGRTLAREVAAAARSGAGDVSRPLRELLGVESVDAGTLLRAEVDGDPELLGRVADELRALAEAPDHGARAGSALVALGAQPIVVEDPPLEPGYPLEAVMPPSWFAEHDDPVNDHPLFLRYIPELRARATWEVPAINVRTDDELEPDGYRILALDEFVEGGRVDPGFVYADEEAVALLGAAAAATAEWVEPLRLMRVPRAAVAGADGLAEILTMRPEEVVTRRLGEVSSAHAERLSGGGEPVGAPSEIPADAGAG